jgi:hypothetical protein
MMVVAASAASAYAGVEQTFDLVLTEISSTNLSLSYNGPVGPSAFTVINTSADHWSITINSNDLFFSDFIWDWQEPEDPINSANEVSHSTQVNSNTIFVVSDLIADALPNNTPAPTFVGFEDSTQFGNIRLTFNDLGDTQPPSGVPDSGSTLGLFAVAAAVVLGASRIRSLQLA